MPREDATPITDPDIAQAERRPSHSTPVRITFGDTERTARLHDDATARNLAAQPADPQLPRPQQCGEGRATAREPSLDGAPAGQDLVAGDVATGTRRPPRHPLRPR